MAAQEIRVPDIGDFSDVPIIEIHVAVGDTVAAEDPLLTLESDKATLDVPSPVAGTITSLAVAVGDTVSEGTVIATVEVAGGAAGGAPKESVTSQPAATAGGGSPETAAGPREELTAPAGYGSSAAPPTHGAGTGAGRAHPPRTPGRRATCTPRSWCWVPGPAATPPRSAPPTSASSVVMVDSRGPLGGVCLNVGCIPSKALLHAAKVIAETKEMSHAGLTFTAPTIDLDALRGWKDGVVTRLTGGLAGLAKQRKVADPGRHRHLHLPEHAHRRRPRRHHHHRVVRLRDHRRRLRTGRPSRSSPTTTPGSSTPPARWTWTTSRSGCWCSAAGSSGWRWPASTPNSAPRSASSS